MRVRLRIVLAVLLLLDSAVVGVGAAPAAARADDYVLAASWQPAHCERLPQRSECVDQARDRFDATHFTLHGLWPQPRSNVYCGVTAAERAASRERRWASLPSLPINPRTRARLDEVMPGTRSFLHRHQWIKHGICFGVDPEAYFRASLRLMEALNKSAVRDLFAERIGRTVSAAEIRRAFDRSFGAGAGRRVLSVCRDVGGRSLVVELRISLRGHVDADARLADLLHAAPEADRGCAVGIVDAAG